MTEVAMQIMEVRASPAPRPVMITVAMSADASRAVFTALSEQLDRRRRVQTTSVEEVLALREQAALVERFESLASAGAHAIAQFTASELRACLLDVTAYADRVNGEHFQPLELRARLETISDLTAALWEANAAASAADGGPSALAA